MKNMVRVLGLLSLFLATHIAQAAIVFNEVQISPTENRFIELYNNSNESVDLTGYYVQRKTATGTSFSSLVTSTNFADKQIGAGKYFVISRVSIDNSDIVLSGITLTESNTIQLKNSSGEVVDKLCWGSADDCGGAKLAPNPGEGKSISLVGNMFLITNPTPGRANQSNSSNDVQDQGEQTEFVSTEYTMLATLNKENSKTNTKSISINVFVNPPAIATVPVEFDVKVFGLNDERLIYGKMVWNFGDGVSKEIKLSDSEKVKHTYFYPGTYTVTLEHYGGDFAPHPNASKRFTVQVIKAPLAISSLGKESDYFVEVSNTSSQDIDLSKWQIKNANQLFILPNHTILAKSQKIIFSPKVTGFVYQNIMPVSLHNPDGELIFSLSPYQEVSAKIAVANKSKSSGDVLGTTIKAKPEVDYVDLTEEENPSAENDHPEDEENSNPLFLGVLGTVILAGAGVVWFLRKSKSPSEEDFEILDE